MYNFFSWNSSPITVPKHRTEVTKIITIDHTMFLYEKLLLFNNNYINYKKKREYLNLYMYQNVNKHSLCVLICSDSSL